MPESEAAAHQQQFVCRPGLTGQGRAPDSPLSGLGKLLARETDGDLTAVPDAPRLAVKPPGALGGLLKLRLCLDCPLSSLSSAVRLVLSSGSPSSSLCDKAVNPESRDLNMCDRKCWNHLRPELDPPSDRASSLMELICNKLSSPPSHPHPPIPPVRKYGQEQSNSAVPALNLQLGSHHQ